MTFGDEPVKEYECIFMSIISDVHFWSSPFTK